MAFIHQTGHIINHSPFKGYGIIIDTVKQCKGVIICNLKKK
jgi:hypothetical protein